MEAEAPALLVWLENSALGVAMRTSPVLYPVVETLHIMGFCVLVGSIIAFDLRVLGVARGLPIELMARYLLPLALCGFALAVPMGFSLFATEATHIADNPSFLTKMTLLILAGVNALLFHLVPWPRVANWDGGVAPFTAKFGAAVSIMLWVGVLWGGRLIAYF